MYHNSDRQNSESSVKSRYSRHSADSTYSQSTAATSVDQLSRTDSKRNSLERPTLDRDVTATRITYSKPQPKSYYYDRDEVRVSVSSYDSSSSSLDSFEDDVIYAEPECYAESVSSDSGDYEYTTPSACQRQQFLYEPQPEASDDAIPTNPHNFAKYFPTSNALKIAHDTATSDGDMNLVVSTETSDRLGSFDMQLYHLRMNDLASRNFSLRRYCRESGREVCHSVVKKDKAKPNARPGLGRTVSNAIASLSRNNSWSSTRSSRSTKSVPSAPKRQDSGYASHEDFDCAYESGPDEESEVEDMPEPEEEQPVGPTNTIKLEFSNYAQVDVRRKGASPNKKWELEYWGTSYEWRRSPAGNNDEGFQYHLYKVGGEKCIAYIKPISVPPHQRQAERDIGAFVPASEFRILDMKTLQHEDVADVIVASGIIALVDDCIRRAERAKEAGRAGMKRSVSFKVGQDTVELKLVTPQKMMESWMRPKSRRGKEESLSRPGTAKSGKVPSSPLKYHATHAY